VIRIAAVGDVHVGLDERDRIARSLAPVADQADVLLLAGDLTRCGDPGEMKTLAGVLEPLELPVIAVLGNHDHHGDRVDEVTRILTDAGVEVLEGTSTTVTVRGRTLGVAGTKGFGGGFMGASASEFGEPVMKQFARCTIEMAAALERALRSLDSASPPSTASGSASPERPVDWRVALLHYSPIPDTLQGEHPGIYAFLGSYLLGEAIDRVGADLVLHGHAHAGTERGLTPGGITVRNVAQPVLNSAYRLFELPDPDPT
jgi:Icc-related predicted phosphoesterase